MIEFGLIGLLEAAVKLLNTVFGDIGVWLTTAPADFAGGGAWDLAESVLESLKGVGYGLLILFFLMSFFKTTTDFRKISLQQTIGWIVRFLLVKVFIDYSLELLTTFISLSIGTNNEILGVSGGLGNIVVPPEITQAVTDSIVQEGFWKSALASFGNFHLWGLAGIAIAVIFICGIIMVVMVFLRFFKLFIYTAIAPLPLSTFGNPDTSGIGKHFLKTYAGACLEICVISLACALFTAVTNNIANFQIWGSWSEGQLIDSGSELKILLNFVITLMIEVVLLTITVSQANKIIKDALGT